MKLGLYCSPLGGVTPPFGHSRKEVAAAIIGAVGAIAATTISAAANSSSVSSANEANKKNMEDTNATNLQIARETNEMSQQQFNQNMQWSKEQFATQRQYALEDREYNSIENQVKRAVNAGINPSAVIGNGSAAYSTTPVGSVGTPSQSNFHVPHMEASHVEPTQYDFSGLSESVGHAVDAYQNSRLINAQVANTNADTSIKRHQDLTTVAEGLARVRKMYSENEVMLQNAKLSESTRKKIEAEQEQIRQNMEYFESVKDDLVRGIRLENTRVERETKHIGFQENIMADESKRAWIDLGIKRALASSQIGLNSAQQSSLYAGLDKIIAETDDISSSAALKKIERAVIEAVESDKSGARVLRKNSKFLHKTHSIAKYLQDILIGDILKFAK